jgi:hypothetical protein
MAGSSPAMTAEGNSADRRDCKNEELKSAIFVLALFTSIG